MHFEQLSSPDMRVFICKQSAISFWQSAWSDGFDTCVTSSVRSLRYAANNATQIRELSLERFGFTSYPLDVLVADANLRCSSDVHKTHLWSTAIAPGSFIEVGRDVFVSSPPFAFVQMASELDAIDLAKLGIELCGCYRLDDIDIRGFSQVEPRIELKQLKGYINRIDNCRGIKAARASMQWVTSVSASPMETVLVLVLCLPTRLGGFGFALPLMNHRIELDGVAAQMAGKPYFVCDLYWPKYKIAIEYDSDMFHTGSEKIANDSLRRNILGYLGITVITVTRQQLYSVQGMESVARQLAKAMGNNRKAARIETTGATRILRERLLFA